MFFIFCKSDEMCIRDRDAIDEMAVLCSNTDYYSGVDFSDADDYYYGLVDWEQGVGEYGDERISVSYTHLDVYKRQRQSFFLTRFLYPSSQLFYQFHRHYRLLYHILSCPFPVSYTHLDVYKRQAYGG